MFAARQEETDRCALFRKEIAALAADLDVEMERLASALQTRRLEEEELSEAEVRNKTRRAMGMLKSSSRQKRRHMWGGRWDDACDHVLFRR